MEIILNIMNLFDEAEYIIKNNQNGISLDNMLEKMEINEKSKFKLNEENNKIEDGLK